MSPWVAGADDHGVFLEVILHHGPPRRLAPREVGDTGVAVALELLGPGSEPALGTPVGPGEGPRQRWSCAGLPGAIEAPRHPAG